MGFSTIHPFPARMAPEVAQESLSTIPRCGAVLDPMCGSGMVARAAVEAGHDCVGRDVDPLAVLMAQAWTMPIDVGRIESDAWHLVQTAKALSPANVTRAADQETKKFISYWFAPRQQEELGRLATALRCQREPGRGALAVALSRIIVSKEMMASLARDTSHSRPHKVAQANAFDVYGGFLKSARHVAVRLKPNLIRGRADIRRADARMLEDVADGSIDLVLTSPPYLNAIDYLRGHRLALVWLGFKVGQLRQIRSGSIGAERALPASESPLDVSPFVTEPKSSAIEPRHRGWIRRYAGDMDAMLRQMGRVVKGNGRVVLVLGNSFIRGATVDNAGLVGALATNVGFRLRDRVVREIPARRRYLPPPSDGQTALDARMREETVLTFSVQ